MNKALTFAFPYINYIENAFSNHFTMNSVRLTKKDVFMTPSLILGYTEVVVDGFVNYIIYIRQINIEFSWIL